MEVTQTIKLNNEEKRAIETAISLFDRISDISKVSMAEVFEYLIDIADRTGDYEYQLPHMLNIADIG